MRREPLINALLGEDSAPPATAAKKASAAKAPPAATNGDAGLSDSDVERIADAVITKLASALTAG